jgi:hypothetical protein
MELGAEGFRLSCRPLRKGSLTLRRYQGTMCDRGNPCARGKGAGPQGARAGDGDASGNGGSGQGIWACGELGHLGRQPGDAAKQPVKGYDEAPSQPAVSQIFPPDRRANWSLTKAIGGRREPRHGRCLSYAHLGEPTDWSEGLPGRPVRM